MTSKEAFENLKEDFYQRFPDDWGKELWVKIEKDLDKLETLQNKLAEYEALEEQGRLIKLPCKVGDKIYKVNFPYIAIDEIEKISVNYKARTGLINEYQIGISAFFNREEAEAMLEQTIEWLENDK